MTPNEQMNVVGQDGTLITRVAVSPDHLAKAVSEQRNVFVAESQQRVFQEVLGLRIKTADFCRRRLYRFSTVMKLSQVFQLLHADFLGRAAAGICRKPPAVGGPDDMIAGYHGSSFVS